MGDAIGDYLAAIEERTREAEIRARKASVRATEERRRRRLAIGLGGTVVVSLVLAGGGWLRTERAADRRRQQIERDARSALREASMQVERASAGDDPVPWEQAVATAQRAAAVAAAPDGTPALRAEVAGEVARITATQQEFATARERRLQHASLARRLRQVEVPVEESDAGMIDSDYWNSDRARRRSAYPAAFRAHGLTPQNRSAKEIADALAGPHQFEFATALYDWSAIEDESEFRDKLLEIVELLDPADLVAELEALTADTGIHAPIREECMFALARFGRDRLLTVALESHRKRSRTDSADQAGALAVQASLLHRAGQYQQAVATHRRVLASCGGDRTVPRQTLGDACYAAACSMARAGMVDDAFAQVERATEIGAVECGVMLADGDLAALRSDPRFAELCNALYRRVAGLSLRPTSRSRR